MASEIVAAFRTVGFVTLVDHGIPEEVTTAAFAQAKEFFAQDKNYKLKFGYKSPESNRGYISVGQESLSETPDLKESFDIGNGENEWPNPRFEKAMLNYFSAYDKLHLDIMRALALGMGYDEEFFTPMNNGNHQNLRLLRYPPAQRSEVQTRAGIHTDYGTITLLSQESGGLLAQTLDGEWIPVPTTGIVVNVGEMLMRWSNDFLRATPHQVVAGDSDFIPERFSIAFFCNANKDCILDCLPGCSSPTNPPKYAPINAHAYITGRLAGSITVNYDGA